jgi:Na+/phosphate symporter
VFVHACRVTVLLQLLTMAGAVALILFGVGYRKVASNFDTLLAALAADDAAGLETVRNTNEALGREADLLRDHHLERLRRGLPTSVESSLLHLEVLTFLRMIHDHLANLAAAASPIGTD